MSEFSYQESSSSYSSGPVESYSSGGAVGGGSSSFQSSSYSSHSSGGGGAEYSSGGAGFSSGGSGGEYSSGGYSSGGHSSGGHSSGGSASFGSSGAAGEYGSASFGSGGAAGGYGSSGAAGGHSSGSHGSISYSSGGRASGSYSAGGAAGAAGAGGFGAGSFGGAGSAGAVNQIASDLLALNQGGRASAAGASHGASFGSSSASFSASISSSGAAGAGSGHYLSEIEQSILRATVPIEVNETENLTVSFKGAQETGLWTNRQEVINWRGVIPITEYILNEDMNPEVITKRTEQQLVYIQELAIRYLRPPTPPAPGEILITQEMNTLTAPAPPLILRQMPARAATPEPLVIREAPPQPPAAVGRKVITISGKRLPPPPRKVIIERLAPLPSKPQSVLVERWLPYAQTKRRVIFQRSNERDAVVVKPRNVIVQWEAPQVVVKKEFKYLGVIRANPVEYVQRYGATLKIARDLPDFVLDIKTPEGIVLAADYQYNAVHELEGDVRALGFVDLDREGLSEYRSLLAKLGITYVGAAGVVAAASQYQSVGGSFAASSSSSASFGASSSASFGARGSSSAVIDEIFSSIDRDGNGQISIEEAARVLLKLNSRLGRSYGQDESRAFFQALDVDRNGQLSIAEFRRAFERLL